jgi:hypothetical protein
VLSARPPIFVATPRSKTLVTVGAGGGEGSAGAGGVARIHLRQTGPPDVRTLSQDDMTCGRAKPLRQYLKPSNECGGGGLAALVCSF